MCRQTSESTEEHPGHSFSNCPWDKEDGSEKVNIDPAWVESVTAAMQGSGDGDTDAVLAQIGPAQQGPCQCKELGSVDLV